MRYVPALASLAFACGASHTPARRAGTPATVFRDAFEDPAAIQRSWIVATPSVSGTVVRVADGSLQLSLSTGKSEVAVRHRLDVSALRGQRVRIQARARTSAPTSVARATVTVVPASGTPSYGDAATTRTVSSQSWADLETVIDVAPTATTADVSLLLRGGGTASFDDVVVASVEPSPRPAAVQLSASQLEHLVTLTRAFGYVRFLHPSDQAAACDWDAFLPAAISQVLHASNRAALRDELRRMFAGVAPTASFVEQGDRTPPALPPKDGATHLARWQHIGLGSSGVYTSLREGRDPETLIVERSVRLKLPARVSCRSAQLEAKLHRGDTGEVWMFLQSRRPGMSPNDTERAVPVGARDLSVKADVPADAQEVRTGVRVKGRGAVTLEELSLVCDGGTRVAVEITPDWNASSYASLYRWTVAPCSAGTCGTLERKPLDTELVPERDILDVDIGSGLRMRVPVAVWADGDRTLPAGEGEVPHRDATIDDLSVRLAAVSATWATLSLFYPYFKDLQIDWDATLRDALRGAAAATQPQTTHDVLSQLVARLRDDHARVTHPASPIDGIVPLALRRFGDKLVVVGGLPEYVEKLPPGTEVVAIDGVPALEAYDRVYARVSAATQGWHDYATPFYLTLGAVGSLRELRVRLPAGTQRVDVIPLVSRDLYDSAIREVRPKTGAEVAPGVFYVDFEGIREETWRAALPSLQQARAIIFDLRGYTTNFGLETLSYVSDHELSSPEWQIPVVGGGGPPRYDTSHWTLFPAAVHLTAPVVVLMDGRSASAVETMLQMIRDAKLARLVGETSGGTNGNTNSFTVPGGFNVRFTGMRVSGPGGATIEGRGITPDKVVHPTLAGVRAGRDEILEAGVAEATRLGGP